MGNFKVSGDVTIDASTVVVTPTAEKLAVRNVEWAADGKSVTVTFNRNVAATENVVVYDGSSYTWKDTICTWTGNNVVTVTARGTTTFVAGDYVAVGTTALADNYGSTITANATLGVKA